MKRANGMRGVWCSPLLLVLPFLALPVSASGCASATGAVAADPEGSARLTTYDEYATPKPLTVNESKLPVGFPRPGPVGKILIKDYPTYRMARVRRGEAGTNSMFRVLFNHIKRNDIPMTAPVEMNHAGRELPETEEAFMAFLYGEPTWGEAGVDVDDPKVKIEDVAPMTVVSIGVRGSYTQARFQKAVTQLEAWLDAHSAQVQPVGKARFFAYNSPFVPGFLKYAEVQIPVERLEEERAHEQESMADAKSSYP